MHEITITYIPDFLKKDVNRKKGITSSLVRCYFNKVWDKPFLFIRKKLVSEKAKVVIQSSSKENEVENVERSTVNLKNNHIQELQTLKKLIQTYFCLENVELKNYYFNYETNTGSEYQDTITHPVQTITKIVPKCIQPYMDTLVENFMQQGIQLTYSFPLNGEYGFVTATNIVKEKIKN